MDTTTAAPEVVGRAEELAGDLALKRVHEWKEAEPGRRAIGYLPVVNPLEIITAAGMYPVGIVGGGDQIEIIRGDAYFQSYICHLPRSVVELGVSGKLDACDGFLFPSTCDVIRNLSGIWRLLFPHAYVKYVDVPHDFSAELGGEWWRNELAAIRKDLGELRGSEISDDELWDAIRVHDRQRVLLRELYDLRAEEPWNAPTSEVYLIQRAGLMLPAAEHVEMLETYIEQARGSGRPRRDHCRIVLSGAFCEQPPLGLLMTLERAGCYIVDDDLLLGPRFTSKDVIGPGGATGDPIQALVDSYLGGRSAASFIYIDEDEKGKALADTVEARGAEGVIFAAPSFCDPALLDRPMQARALDERGVSHVSLKYSENTGQFQPIREQAGTFADALKLWGEA